VVTAAGRLVLLTRAPDRLQAAFTSILEDVRIWTDDADASPYAELRTILEELGLGGCRIGVEYEAYGLTAAKGMALMKALTGRFELTDASMLICEQRLIKSPAELEYVRRAAELADVALAEANQLAKPKAWEGDILAAMQGAIYRGGGDDPANEFVIGSGPGALMCRYYSGRRHLSADDQLTLEFAGVYRHYHACLMRTILVGKPNPQQLDMHVVARHALAAARDALAPGRAIGGVFDAHAAVLDKAGHREHRLNACGYSLGSTFAPNWMDWPMFYHGNEVIAEPRMVFFIHIIIFDQSRGLAMTLGQTVEVTVDGNRALSSAPLDLVVNP
jgi:Xaa-Pro dipeptidase